MADSLGAAITYRVNPILRFEVLEVSQARAYVGDHDQDSARDIIVDGDPATTRGIGVFDSYGHAVEVAKAMGEIARHSTGSVTIDGGHKPEAIIFAYTPEHARMLQDMASALAASLPRR